MASVQPTRHGTFEVKWRENGRQKSESRKTKGEAERLKVEVENRVAGGRHVVRSKDAPTLETFAASWLAGRNDLEDSTKRKYTEWLEVHILPSLGHISVADLRPRRLQEWQDTRLAEGAGPAVLGKAQSLLSQILKKAVLPYEYLDVNPVLALDRPSYEKREHRWLTAAEVEALRMWFLERNDHGSATLISALAYIGPRPGNQLARIWPDLQPEPPQWVRNPAPGSGALRVTTRVSEGKIKGGTKTSSSQMDLVYVPQLVIADFEEWRAASKGGEGLIYPRTKDGEPWTKDDWDNWRSRIRPDGEIGYSFKQAARDTGIGTSVTPYALRHSAATLCAAGGWTYVEIAQQIQHSPETSARLYQHLTHEAATGRTVDDYIREARGIAPVRDSFGAEVG